MNSNTRKTNTKPSPNRKTTLSSLGVTSTLKDVAIENIKSNKVLKVGLYVTGAFLLIYLFGKASKIISVSVVEFKQLADAIKK